MTGAYLMRGTNQRSGPPDRITYETGHQDHMNAEQRPHLRLLVILHSLLDRPSGVQSNIEEGGGGKEEEEEEEGGVDVTFAVTNLFRIVYGC